MKKWMAVLLCAVMMMCMPMAAQADVEVGTITAYDADGNVKGTYDTVAAAFADVNAGSLGIVRLEFEAGKLIANGGSHSSLQRSLIVNGNGATLVHTKIAPAGEATFAIEEFGYPLLEDVTLIINDLKNATVWGTRHSDLTLTLEMNNCDTSSEYATGQRVYLTSADGVTGKNHITLNNCDFAENASSCTVYSNAAGSVTLNNCTFSDVEVPVNINTKATSGSITVAVNNSIFTNCGTGTDATMNSYAAPIRVVNAGGASSTLKVNNVTFNNCTSPNGDILLGDGRTGKTSHPVSAQITNTDADVQLQQPGYYDSSYQQNNTGLNLETIEVTRTQTIGVTSEKGKQNIFTVQFFTNGGTAMAAVKVPGGSTLSGVLGSKALPTRAGYTFSGWYSDAALTKVVGVNEAIKADMALYAGWSQIELAGRVPQTGDNSQLVLWFVMMAAAALCAASILRRTRKV